MVDSADIYWSSYSTYYKHNKKEAQYLNSKACLLIFQPHVISMQAQNEAFNGEDILGVKIT